MSTLCQEGREFLYPAPYQPLRNHDHDASLVSTPNEALQFTPHNCEHLQLSNDYSPVKLVSSKDGEKHDSLSAQLGLHGPKGVPRPPQKVSSRSIQYLAYEQDLYTYYDVDPVTIAEACCRSGPKHGNGDGQIDKKRFEKRAFLYEARNKFTSDPCIIKVIPKSKCHASAHGEQMCKILCEKLLQISSHHPGLMSISNVFETDDKFFIICEKLEGGELFDFLLLEKAVPEELCKYIIKQVLHALHYLHSNFLVHRDVKPENLMFRRSRPKIRHREEDNFLAKESKAKERPMTSLECSRLMSLQQLSSTFELSLIDFDTCKVINSPLEDTQEVCNGRRRLVGTYGYLAPEVLKGHQHTTVSDLWSVGIILYILITGAPPVPMELMVSAKASLEILESIRKLGIDFQLSPFPEFPKARALCQALLEFDPARRIPSACQALQHPWLQAAASNTIPLRGCSSRCFCDP